MSLRAEKVAHAVAALETIMSAGEEPAACSDRIFWKTSSLSRSLAESFLTQAYFFLKSRTIGALFSSAMFE